MRRLLWHSRAFRCCARSSPPVVRPIIFGRDIRGRRPRSRPRVVSGSGTRRCSSRGMSPNRSPPRSPARRRQCFPARPVPPRSWQQPAIRRRPEPSPSRVPATDSASTSGARRSQPFRSVHRAASARISCSSREAAGRSGEAVPACHWEAPSTRCRLSSACSAALTCIPRPRPRWRSRPSSTAATPASPRRPCGSWPPSGR